MNLDPTIEGLQQKVAELEALLENRTCELSKEITDCKMIKADMEKQTLELNRHVRDMKALLQIIKLGDSPGISMKDFISSILKIIVSCFRYPDMACVEIKIGEKLFQTKNYNSSPWKISRKLTYQQQVIIGHLTVCYSEEKPENGCGPFTREEKNLLTIISQYLVQIIRRRQFEEEKEKFRQVISQSPSMIIIANKEGKIEYVNDQLIKTLSYSPEELYGTNNFFLANNPQGLKLQEDITKVLLGKQQFAGELEIDTKDGKSIWVNAKISPILNHNETEFYVVVMEDISTEMYLKKINLEQQLKLNAIMDNIPVAITLLDWNGHFLYYNKQAQTNFRLPPEILEQKSLKEIFPEEGSMELKDIRKVFRKKKPSLTDMVYKIQGQDYHVKLNRLPLLDSYGNVQSVLSISQDITQRVHEQKLLRIRRSIDSLQSIGNTFQESLKLLFDHLFELDWLDAGGLYLINNDKGTLDLVFHRGLSESFVKKASSYPLDSSNALLVLNKIPRYNTSDNFLASSRDYIYEEKITFTATLPLVNNYIVIGSLNLGSRKVTEIGDADRQAIESIALKIANLLELIKTRERLEQSNYDLNKHLLEIKQKQDLLVQKSKLESLGELAAGLAHEINQPLSIISLAFENITYKLLASQAHTEYFARKAETINLNIDKIRQLIDHIRLFSRDQSSVMFEKVDVNEAIMNTLNLIKTQLKQHKIEVVLDLYKGDFFTLGNLTKMEQVMMNLLSNARDGIDEKNNKMKAKVFIKRIFIKTFIEDQKLIVWVEDNGTGIRSEDIKKIFTPFFTTKPPGRGTGLGLAIVYGIITEMKGTIEISSENEKFTKILLTFPKI